MSEIIVFDTETTGLPNWKEPSGDDCQPHIVQLAAHVFDMDVGQIKQTMNVIVKPNGWVIPEEVVDVHGITTEYASDVGVDESLALDMFLALWGGRKQVAHNTTFDRRIIRIATKRYCDESVQDSWKECEYDCTMLMSKPIMELLPKGRYGYKNPKLEEAYTYFTGNTLEGAHTAINDVNACLSIYLAIKSGVTDNVSP